MSYFVAFGFITNCFDTSHSSFGYIPQYLNTCRHFRYIIQHLTHRIRSDTLREVMYRRIEERKKIS